MMVALSTPLLGRGGMVVRTSRSPQSCWCSASSSRSFGQEQDHVIAKTGRHELEAPEPNHRGARNQRVDTVFWARVQDGRIKWQYAIYKMNCR